MLSVFLGGTCASSTWRERLIPMLEIGYFNPVVEDWTEEAQEEEKAQRETCDFVLYTITPEMQGVYSIAEVVDDSNKRPEKTVFCILDNESGKSFSPEQKKSLDATAVLVQANGGKVCRSLEQVAEHLNWAGSR